MYQIFFLFKTFYGEMEERFLVFLFLVLSHLIISILKEKNFFQNEYLQLLNVIVVIFKYYFKIQRFEILSAAKNVFILQRFVLFLLRKYF